MFKNDVTIELDRRQSVINAQRDALDERQKLILGLIDERVAMLDILRKCEDRMTNEMSEAEQLEHDLDGHGGSFCLLCQCREVIAAAEGGIK